MISKSFNTLLFFYFILCFWGCSFFENENVYIGDVRYITEFPKETNLIGEKIHIENIGAETIDCIDSFLIFSTRNTDTYYSIYSTHNFTHIGNYISKGMGANEMININHPAFLKMEGNNAILYIYDNQKHKLRSLNITESSINNYSILEDKIELKSGLLNKFMYPINDSTYFFHGFDIEQKNEYYALYNKNIKQLDILNNTYNSSLQNIGNVFLYNTFKCFNEEKQKYVTAMQFFNQINIYDYTQKESPYSLIIGNYVSNLREVENKEMPDKMEHYQDLVCTEKYILALYAGCTRKDWAFSENLHVKIHIFDWNGNPICQLLINEKIAKIAYDEKLNLLYGMTLEEDVYKYNMPL